MKIAGHWSNICAHIVNLDLCCNKEILNLNVYKAKRKFFNNCNEFSLMFVDFYTHFKYKNICFNKSVSI